MGLKKTAKRFHPGDFVVNVWNATERAMFLRYDDRDNCVILFCGTILTVTDLRLVKIDGEKDER